MKIGTIIIGTNASAKSEKVKEFHYAFPLQSVLYLHDALNPVAALSQRCTVHTRLVFIEGILNICNLKSWLLSLRDGISIDTGHKFETIEPDFILITQQITKEDLKEIVDLPFELIECNYQPEPMTIY